MRDDRIYIKIIVNFIIMVIAALFVFLLVPKILGFFLPFVIGWIVAMIANPLVRFLDKKMKIHRKHSSALIIIVVVAVIVGVSYLLVAVLAKEVEELGTDMPHIVKQASIQINATSEKISSLSKALPKGIQEKINDFTNNFGKSLNNFIQGLKPFSPNTYKNLFRNIAEGFLLIIITILSAYFFIAQRDEIVARIKKIMPKAMQDNLNMIYGNFKTAIGGYFKAQFKIMLVLIIIMFVGFEILHFRYSILSALGIAFLDFLPVFGTGVVLWPWAIAEVLMGNYVKAAGLIIIYLICLVLKQILQPKMVGDSVGISPLATLLFMFIGYRLYSVIGMILGIPVGMALVNMYRIGMFDRLIRGLRIIAHDINEFRKY